MPIAPAWRRVAGAVSLVFVLLPALAAPDGAPDVDETRRLHALFDRHWEESAQRFPEWATYRGDRRFDDRFSDVSAAGIADTDAWNRRLLADAQAIRRDMLAPTDRVSLDLFIDVQQRQVAMQAFDGFRRQTLGSLFGFQSQLAGLLRLMPASTPARGEQVLARLAA